MAQRTTIEAHIADVDLFRDLSKRQLKRLVEAVKEASHPAGKEVATEGLGGAGVPPHPRRDGHRQQGGPRAAHPRHRATTSARSA